jgi:hypothetical protein
VRVPGASVHSFLGNLALIYLVAGLWKWQSPMWLDGSALYAGLKMPIARAPEFWQAEHLPLLRLFNYAALVVEPLLALVVILPRHHPLKWFLVACAAGLHGGIILTLRIPYANAIFLCSFVLILRDELMALLRGPVRSRPSHPPLMRLDWPGRLGFVLVMMLTLAMIGDILPWWIEPSGLSRQAGPDGMTFAPGQVQAAWRSHRQANNPWEKVDADGNPLYAPLWLVGIAQKYRLFDWIDDVNYTGHYEILEMGAPPINGQAAAQRLFPNTMRGAILQTYVNDVRWVIIPSPWANSVKQSLFGRIARRYCQTYTPRQPLEVFVTVEQITVNNRELDQGYRERLMAFTCNAGEPSLTYMRVAPEMSP